MDVANALWFRLRLVFARTPSRRQNVGLGNFVSSRGIVIRLVVQRQKLAVDSLDGLLDPIDEVAVFIPPLEDAGRLVASSRKKWVRLLDGRPPVVKNDDLAACLGLQSSDVDAPRKENLRGNRGEHVDEGRLCVLELRK